MKAGANDQRHGIVSIKVSKVSLYLLWLADSHKDKGVIHKMVTS